MIDGLYILTIVAAFAALLIIWTYNEWARWDEYRRLERRAHRNLRKQCGQ